MSPTGNAQIEDVLMPVDVIEKSDLNAVTKVQNKEIQKSYKLNTTIELDNLTPP